MDGSALRLATAADVFAEIARLQAAPGQTPDARAVAADRIALLVRILPTEERAAARMSPRWTTGILNRARAVLVDPRRRAAALALGPLPQLVPTRLNVAASALVDEAVSPLDLLRTVRGMGVGAQALRQKLMAAAWADGASAAEIAEAIAGGGE